MNIILLLSILILLIWSGIHTVSYGIWTMRDNKKGGIALFVLAAASVLVPLCLIWLRS